MAKSKISNTLPSSNKKLNRQLVTGQTADPKAAAPHLVTVVPPSITPELRKEIAREVLLEISSYCWPAEEYASNTEGPYLWGATQVNADLALVARCELCEDIYTEDSDFFALLRSPMYRSLVQQFMEDAMGGDESSLLKAVWRAYKAGLASPNRFIPDSKEVRHERRLNRQALEAEAASRGKHSQ
jgi:hypothetical protein